MELEELKEGIEKIEARLTLIETHLERQKGFIGGILFIFGILAYFINLVKDLWGNK